MTKTLFAALTAALLAVGCSDVHTPGQASAPLPPKPTPGAQARMILLAASRQDQQLDVSAQVLDGNGAGIPSIDVAFSIAGGTVTPALVKTDATGMAKATAIASGNTTLTATTGALTEKIVIIGGAIPLSVTLSASPVVVGTASSLHASVTGTAIGGPFAYVWTFGDGTSATGDSNTIAHTYPRVDSYPATVKITDGAGRTAAAGSTVTVNDPPATTPTPTTTTDTSGLVASLTCTANAHGTASPCNVSVVYNGKALASTAITGIAWDWGDGSTVPGGTVPLGSHNYAQAGTYVVTATATATTTDGSKTAPIVSKSLVITGNNILALPDAWAAGYCPCRWNTQSSLSVTRSEDVTCASD